jgi:hypothetical protein
MYHDMLQFLIVILSWNEFRMSVGIQSGGSKMYEVKKQRLESLQYVQSMLGQLRLMSDAERCDMLSYLIEMAYVECSDIVRGDRPSRVNEEKRRSAA